MTQLAKIDDFIDPKFVELTTRLTLLDYKLNKKILVWTTPFAERSASKAINVVGGNRSDILYAGLFRAKTDRALTLL